MQNSQVGTELHRHLFVRQTVVVVVHHSIKSGGLMEPLVVVDKRHPIVVVLEYLVKAITAVVLVIQQWAEVAEAVLAVLGRLQ
jgi:hypothetical protein